MNEPRIARIVGTEPGALAVVCDGIEYRPTDDYLAIGVLLFGLGPVQLEHTLPALSTASWHFTHASDVLHAYARGQRAYDGSPVLTHEQLAEWVAGAAALAPDEATSAETLRRTLARVT